MRLRTSGAGYRGWRLQSKKIKTNHLKCVNNCWLNKSSNSIDFYLWKFTCIVCWIKFTLDIRWCFCFRSFCYRATFSLMSILCFMNFKTKMWNVQNFWINFCFSIFVRLKFTLKWNKPLNGFLRGSTIHLVFQTFCRTIRMSKIEADLYHDLELIRYSFADSATVDCACLRRARDYFQLNPDANASNSVCFHYCLVSSLYLKIISYAVGQFLDTLFFFYLDEKITIFLTFSTQVVESFPQRCDIGRRYMLELVHVNN